MSRWTGEKDVFAANRVDEQLAKALDRKVWLPSGGYLVIDRTEAMIVVDVNTGKFTGAGGNLEETVTKNNLEAAEEIVRQLRLRDLGGIIVIDFIDMVLESNRDLVLRRLIECLGRDRTKHQVAEVTSLGLVQMTRKRVGQGLHEAFSETCEALQRPRLPHPHRAGRQERTAGGRQRRAQGRSRRPGTRRGQGRRRAQGRRRRQGREGPRRRSGGRGRKDVAAADEAVDGAAVQDAAGDPVAIEDPVEAPDAATVGSEPVDSRAGGRPAGGRGGPAGGRPVRGAAARRPAR